MPFPPTKDSSEEHAPRNDVYVVQETDALVRRTLMALAHLPVERPLEGAARERLRDLRLHLEEALAALGRIEQRGGLTDQGLAHRRAFRMLLAVPTQKREGGLR